MTENNNNNNNFEHLIGEWSKNVYFLKLRSTFANNDGTHTHTHSRSHTERMRRKKAERQTEIKKLKKSNGNIQTQASIPCIVPMNIQCRERNMNKNLYFDLFACFLAIYYIFVHVCTLRGYIFLFSVYL